MKQSLGLALSHKKYFILDLDGTLYQGSQVFPYTRKFLQTLRKTGRQPIFLTNNSSKSTQEYFKKLRALDFARSTDEIYTSGRATIEYLQKKGINEIFLLATPAVEKEFEDAGFKLLRKSPLNLDPESKNQNGFHEAKNGPKSLRAQTKLQEVRTDVKNIALTSARAQYTVPQLPQAVVLAFDMTFTYQKFCIAHDLIIAGVPFYATHPDLLLPIENHIFHPDIGTLIAAITAATGVKPHIIGKPQKHIFEQLRSRLSRTSGVGCKKSEMVMVGDRLYTDIKGANDYGIDTILVLSGETTRKMLTNKSPQPTFIVANVGKLTGEI